MWVKRGLTSSLVASLARKVVRRTARGFASGRRSAAGRKAKGRAGSVRSVSGPTCRRPVTRRRFGAPPAAGRTCGGRRRQTRPGHRPACGRSNGGRLPAGLGQSSFLSSPTLPLQRHHRLEELSPGLETTHPLDLCGMVVLSGNPQDYPLAGCQRAVAAYFEAATGEVDDLDLDFTAVAVDERRPDCRSDPRTTRRPGHTATAPPWLWCCQLNIGQCSSQRLSSAAADG